MSASLVRTPSGVFVADVTPADVVDRCARCRQTFREGDWLCDHLAAATGETIARLAGGSPTPAAAAPAVNAFTPVFLAPQT